MLWAAGVIGLWTVGVPVTGGLLTGLLLSSLLLGLVPWVRGDAQEPPPYRTLAASVLRWTGVALFALYTANAVAMAFGSGSSSGAYGSSGIPTARAGPAVPVTWACPSWGRPSPGRPGWPSVSSR
ncbi:hypothetical protein SHIRM173S_07763 [Streptomyces hirsutus]